MSNPPNSSNLPNLSSLLSLLDSITDELAGLRIELGEAMRVEHDQKTRSWIDQPGGSDKTRSQIAAFHALELTADIYTLRSQVLALEDQRLRVTTLINNSLYVT